MSHTSLRIKKIFFDLIKSGEKRVEYRKNSVFYRRLLLARKIKTIELHYQKPNRITIEVESIRLIDRPEKFRGNAMLPTEKVFAISIRRVVA